MMPSGLMFPQEDPEVTAGAKVVPQITVPVALSA
jgi:hypothetical protein